MPGALPFVFTGLRMASRSAVIAAVVAEYFGGLQNGLGTRITSAASNTAYPRAWAYVVGRDAPSACCSTSSRCARADRDAVASPLMHCAIRAAAHPDTTSRPRRTACVDHDAEGSPRPSAGWRVLLAACGSSSSSAPAPAETGSCSAGGLIQVKLQLQWFTQAQFAGYYAAVDQGYYKDEGLDVQILEGGVDIVPQTVLAQGNADYAIAWVPKALASREQGAAITDVARSSQRSGTLQVSSRTRASRRRPTSRARRSATGASATSTSCSPG